MPGLGGAKGFMPPLRALGGGGPTTGGAEFGGDRDADCVRDCRADCVECAGGSSPVMATLAAGTSGVIADDAVWGGGGAVVAVGDRTTGIGSGGWRPSATLSVAAASARHCSCTPCHSSQLRSVSGCRSTGCRYASKTMAAVVEDMWVDVPCGTCSIFRSCRRW